MPFKYITTAEVTSSQSELQITNIPQTYTHLLLIYSGRQSQDNTDGEIIAGWKTGESTLNYGIYTVGASGGNYWPVLGAASDNGGGVPSGHMSSYRALIPRYSDTDNYKIQFTLGAVAATSNNNSLFQGFNAGWGENNTAVVNYALGGAQTNISRCFVWIYGISNS